MKKNNKELVTGVAWYRPEQWHRLLDISVDRDELEATYEEWLIQAEDGFTEITQSGISLIKVDIDVEELLKWANDKGRIIDGNTRVEYTIEKLKESHEKEDQG